MMIPRTVVPANCAAPSASPARPPRRLKTWLDDRSLIPQDLPIQPFSGISSIPSHVPLDVLNNRVLIDRDMPVIPFPQTTGEETEPPTTEMDERVVVPQTARLERQLEPEPFSAVVLQGLIESDVLVAGEPRLMPEKKAGIDWDMMAALFSVALHVLLFLSFLLIPGMLTRVPITPVRLANDTENLGYIYLPPTIKQAPKPVHQKPSNKIRLDVGASKKPTPPKPKISPQQGPAARPVPKPAPPKAAPPVESAREIPQRLPQPPRAKPQSQPKPEPRIESIKPVKPLPMIAPPSMVPGSAIQQSLRAAAQQRMPDIGFQDQIPPPPSTPGGSSQQGGQGPGYLGGSVQLLTPTQGVDFTNYIQRLLAIVRRNWYAVMPESAMLGERGRVMLRFKIERNGSLPSGEPILEITSGHESLDRAAEAAITASNPFDPLPQAFTGPDIELRFIFLYNMPLHSQ